MNIYKIKINGVDVEIERLPNGMFKKPHIARKYASYRYSIAPLKQCVEEIMVFQKPYKTGSALHDTLSYESGDKTCAVGALNIGGNRVGMEKIGGGTMPDLRDVDKKSIEAIGIDKLSFGQVQNAERKEYEEHTGRYPAQTFVDNETAKILDAQSGIFKSPSTYIRNYCGFNKNAYGKCMGQDEGVKSLNYGDVGGCSKILHKCRFEEGEYDLYLYCPKVSKSERNAGLDDFEDKVTGHNTSMKCDICGKWTLSTTDPCQCPREDRQEQYVKQKNPHPTLKAISLNTHILKLFKTPNPQKILYPFAGTGSEIIGGIKAGFNDWLGCEISEEWVKVAIARIKYWTNADVIKLSTPAPTVSAEFALSPDDEGLI